MIAHVIDDLFDMPLLAELEKVILDKVPVYSTNVANQISFPVGYNGGSHRLFGADIFSKSGLNRVESLHPEAGIFFNMFDIIEHEVFNCPIMLWRIDVNLQFMDQHGTPHTDGDGTEEDVTVMLFNNTKWKKEWGGQFQMLDETEQNVIEEHEYIPGRLIVFPGGVPHRGLAPLIPYMYRYSTVFRCKIDGGIDSFINSYYNSHGTK